MVNPELATIAQPAAENHAVNRNIVVNPAVPTAADNHAVNHNTVVNPEVVTYEVCEGYDDTLLEAAEAITLRELERLQDPPPETSADPEAIADFNQEKLNRKNADKDGFLFALLLKIKPKVSDDHHLPFQNSRYGVKKPSLSKPYLRIYHFASLNDTDGKTFAIIDHNLESSQCFWGRDLALLGVRVGERFAIVNPKITGFLPNGEALIETGQAVEMLKSPTLPIRLINMKEITDVMKYFIFKGIKISCPTPFAIRSECNTKMCDRIDCKTRGTHCGCIGQESRKDDGWRNTVLCWSEVEMKLDHGTVPPALNFTSLRLSQLLFDQKPMPKTAAELTKGYAKKIIKSKWKIFEEYVNEHHGWTAVGWFQRGRELPDTVGQTDTAQKQYVSIHLCYLIPTKNGLRDLRQKKCTITLEDLEAHSGLSTKRSGSPTDRH